MGTRGHAGGPVSQELNLDAQRRRADRAAAVLVVGGALECGAHRDVQLRQGAGVLAAQIQIERSEEHTSELQSLAYLVCRLLLEKKKNIRRRTSNVKHTAGTRQQ